MHGTDAGRRLGRRDRQADRPCGAPGRHHGDRRWSPTISTRSATTTAIVGAFRAVRGGEAIAEAEKVDDQPELAQPAAGRRAGRGQGEHRRSPACRPGTARRRPRTPVAERRPRGGPPAARRRRGRRRHDPDAGAGPLGAHRRRRPRSTRNPWRTDRTPGGSSGGVGRRGGGRPGADRARQRRARLGPHPGRLLRPGRAQARPRRGAGRPRRSDWFGLVEHGMLATTVADAALGFAVLAGRDAGAAGEPGRLRVAVSLRSPVAGSPAGRECAPRRRRGRRELLVGLGHDAVTADPVYPLLAADPWHGDLVRRRLPGRHRPGRRPRHAAAAVRRAHRAGRAGRSAAAWSAAGDRAAWRERVLGWFADGRFDVLITPALAGPPPVATDWSTRSWRANVAACARFAPVRRPVEPRRPARVVVCRSASAPTACRSPCNWSAAPAAN